MPFLSNLIPSLTRSETSAQVSSAAPTVTGPTVRPHYEVKPTADGYALTVFLPGVTKDTLDLSVEEGELTITGQRAWKRPEGWTPLYRETSESTFRLVLTHDNVIDLDKVRAELRDGVLQVALPKAAALQPRKIAVA